MDRLLDMLEAVPWGTRLVAGMILGLLCFLFFYGCDAPIRPQENDAKVSLVTLDDGTRCAVMIGFRFGGIDCDWGRGQGL